MTRATTSPSDLEVMEHADGEFDDPELSVRIERDPDARARLEAIQEIGELVRGHLELSADAAHDARFGGKRHQVDDPFLCRNAGNAFRHANAEIDDTVRCQFERGAAGDDLAGFADPFGEPARARAFDAPHCKFLRDLMAARSGLGAKSPISL